MSQENVELVRRAQPERIDMVKLFRSSNAPDPAVTPDSAGVDATVFADDFEVEFISETYGSLRPPSRGPQGFAEAWLEWLEPWESYQVELEGFIDAGDKVVSLVRVLARSERDAVPVEHQPAAVWAVRDGKVVSVRFYLEREAALEAAAKPE